MTRFSNAMRIISVVLFSCAISAKSDNATDSGASFYQTVEELNYGIAAYECDDELQEISQQNRHQRKMGSSYRVCFEPNGIAKESGVGIKEIESWEWKMGYDDDVVQETVLNGKAVSGLSQFECMDGGRLCVFDSLLKTDFYEFDDSVRGYGAFSFTSGIGSLPFKFSLFLAAMDFSFTMTQNGEGLIEFKNTKSEGNDEKAEENDDNINEGVIEGVNEAKEEL